MRRGAAALAFLALGLAAGPTGPLGAQQVIAVEEDLDFDRPEAWAMKYFTSLTLMTGFGAPEALPPGAVEVGLEAGWVPRLSAEERRVGFNGSKVEDLNKTPVFGRLRLEVGLPAGFSLALGWVPPVEVGGVEPSLLSLALARPLAEAPRWRLGLRLSAGGGTLRGDITCTAEEAALAPGSPGNLFGCEEASNDEMTVRYASLELSASLRPAGWRGVEPHLALAGSYLEPEFQVDAVYAGLRDRTRQRTEGSTWSLLAGATWPASQRSRLVVEAFYTPLEVVRRPGGVTEREDLFNLRVLLRLRAR